MDSLILIAGVLFGFCAILLLVVMLYKSKPSAAVYTETKREETGETLSYENKWKRWIPRFTKTFPDIEILFDKTALPHGVFLEGRLKEKKENTLYVFHSGKTLDMFLQAMEEMMGNYELSVLSADILFTDAQDGKAEQEVVHILKEKRKRYAMCLLDTSGIIRRDNLLFGCVGVMGKCMMGLSCDHKEETTWYGRKVFLPKNMRKLLPFRLRLQLCLPFYEKGKENLVTLFPEGREYFTSFLHVTDGEMIISARDEEAAEELLSRYRKHTTENLVLKEQLPSSPPAEDDVVAMVIDAIAASFENVLPVAVMKEDKISICLDPFIHSKIAFVPTGLPEVSHQAAVAFYRNIRLKEGKRT